MIHATDCCKTFSFSAIFHPPCMCCTLNDGSKLSLFQSCCFKIRSLQSLFHLLIFTSTAAVFTLTLTIIYVCFPVSLSRFYTVGSYPPPLDSYILRRHLLRPCLYLTSSTSFSVLRLFCTSFHATTFFSCLALLLFDPKTNACGTYLL